MKIALVGNNDGPLILTRSMAQKNLRPTCIGLQKKVASGLDAQYLELIDRTNYFSSFDETGLLAQLDNFKPDILINCFCNFKFRKLLDHYETLNVHLSPLPRYRGRHPLQWALINGEKSFGVSIHGMDHKFDAGKIYWQKHIRVSDGMSVAALRDGLMRKVARGFGSFLESFLNGGRDVMENPDSRASYAPKRTPEDSRLTEWEDHNTIYRKVMALRSENYPAYLELDGEKIQLFEARISGAIIREQEAPSILKVHERGVDVLCADGCVVGLFGFDPAAYSLKSKQAIL